MVINGIDYTLYIIVGVSVLIMAGLEYLICIKAKNKSMRKAMLFIPFFILVASLFIYGAEPNGSFLDMRGIVSFLVACYGLISVAAIGIGWFVFKLKYENQPEIPEDCPLSEK